MPKVHEHIHFRKQKKMAGGFGAALSGAIADLSAAAPTTDAFKLSLNLRNAVYTACQMHDQAQLVKEIYFKAVPGSARCAGDTDWCIFYALDVHSLAGNVQLLMLGRIAAQPARLEAFFDFRISEADAVAFDGASEPATDQSVDMNYPTTVLSNHGNKHFGVDRGANQYDIGATSEARYRIVRGMEEKAAEHGVRWPPSVGQFDGLAKLGPDYRQAANRSTPPVPYASSGVHPARVL